MNAVWPQTLEKAWTHNDVFKGLIVRHHAHHDATRLNGLARLVRQFRSLRRKRLRFARGTIIDRERVPRLKKTACHSLSHITKANKPDLFAHLFSFSFA